MPQRHHINPPLSIYRKIAFSFIVLTVILIGVVFYFTLSYSYITITPNAKEVSTDFNFIIVEDSNAQKPDEGIFAGQIINQTLGGEKEFDATGSQQVSSEFIGKVKLLNKLSSDQILIVKTRLLSPEGNIFRLKNQVEIPANGSIVTDVYPDDLTKTTATAGTKFTVPGLSQNMQQFISAEAVSDFLASGQMLKVVSQEDLDKAVVSYADELAQQAVKDADDNMAKILSKEVVAKEFSQKAGDQADKLKLKLNIKVIGVIFDENQVKTFAKKTLEGQVTADYQLVSDSSDQLIYEIEKTDLANKLVQIKSNVKGMTVISENSQILDREKLIRMSQDDLKSYLENFDSVEKVEISFFPSWAKKMPFFQDHIIIKVNK
ncbi:MAG: hypothetical protein NTX82_02730 [Candidatus Parcubacteria bacterium]|nr:hypothetical protein [Candidatus Parcubacteria bacterium]